MPRHKRKRQFEKIIANRYHVEKLLGEGGFCVVFKAYDKESGQKVAVKRMDKSKPLYRKFQNPKAMEKLNNLMYREADVMRALEHENIMQLLDFIDDGVHIYLVMEFAEGGELCSRLMKMRRLPEHTVVVIIKQVVKGIKFMHDQGYIHRDIKAENILFRDKKSTAIIITDFGLSKQIDGLVYTNCGTLVYSAPELLLNKENKRGYDKMVDNWAIGVLTYYLLSGHLPFDDVQQNDNRIINKILKGKVCFPFSEWNMVNQTAKNFITRLLEYDASKRMELHEALEHNFLHNVKINQRKIQKSLHVITTDKKPPFVKERETDETLYLFPMMEANRLQILAKIRWQVVMYFCLTIIQLKYEISNYKFRK